MGPLIKFIHQIYLEKINQQAKFNIDVSIFDAIRKSILLNFGKNNITELRIFKVFSSALFSSVNYDGTM